MKRGEIWWAQHARLAGRRPVVLLSRDEAYAVRELVAVAPVTTRIRKIPAEVPLGRKDGLRRRCAANVDVITTIPKRALVERIAQLSSEKARALNAAIRFSLGLENEP